MKEIKLSQNGLKNNGLVALVDDEDYEDINRYKWMAIKNHNVYYAIRKKRKNNVITYFFMHRCILGITDPLISIDHKDNNGLNNQKDNIRVCTGAQNQYNKRPSKNGKSKYKGVFYEAHRVKKKWRAVIRVNKKPHHLGNFLTQEEAAIAYNKAALEFHKEFAWLNEITVVPAFKDQGLI